jgi:phospholipid/cholesterol/gamma-HCH transport system ATP-binding protein
MIKKSKIEVRNLNKTIDYRQILKNISFTIEPEEHFVIIGGSGAGKSMLAKCILGLEDISSGSIFFDGKLIRGNADRQRILNKLGVCFQSNALFDSYNTWQNIAFKKLYNEKSPNISKLRKLATERLREVGLPTNIAENYPSELSGGMQKRVGIARSIFSEPDILIFDEPTTGLDPIMSKKIISLISKIIKDSKKTAITITHDINLAMFLATKIILLDNGKVEWSGNPKQAILSKNKLLKIFLNG